VSKVLSSAIVRRTRWELAGPFNFRTIADLKYFKIMCGVEQ
jgi:hypothetical protein